MSGYQAFSRYYDKLTGNVHYCRRAEYFDALICRHGTSARGLLLDLACGTGSLALELAKLGYDVIGADASADMLAVAMQKAASAPKSPLFLHQAMDKLDLYGTVEHTVCALDSLNHLPGERVLSAVFSRVALFTQPGGLFVFDVNTAYKHQEVLADNAYVYELDDFVCTWQNRYHPKDHRVDMVLDFFEREQDGRYRRSSERFSERIFSPRVLQELLAQNGFCLEATYGDDTFEPPHAQTQRAVYIAKRFNH